MAGSLLPSGAPIDWTTTDAAGFYELDMVPGDAYYAVQYRETPVGTSDHLRTDAKWVPVWWDSDALLRIRTWSCFVLQPELGSRIRTRCRFRYNTTVDVEPRS